MFYLFSAIVLLVPALFGGYMLFTPMERLIAGVAWTRLPMPKEGTTAYALLRAFCAASASLHGCSSLLVSIYSSSIRPERADPAATAQRPCSHLIR